MSALKGKPQYLQYVNDYDHYLDPDQEYENPYVGEGSSGDSDEYEYDSDFARELEQKLRNFESNSETERLKKMLMTAAAELPQPEPLPVLLEEYDAHYMSRVDPRDEISNGMDIYCRLLKSREKTSDRLIKAEIKVQKIEKSSVIEVSLPSPLVDDEKIKVNLQVPLDLKDHKKYVVNHTLVFNGYSNLRDELIPIIEEKEEKKDSPFKDEDMKSELDFIDQKLKKRDKFKLLRSVYYDHIIGGSVYSSIYLSSVVELSIYLMRVLDEGGIRFSFSLGLELIFKLLVYYGTYKEAQFNLLSRNSQVT